MSLRPHVEVLEDRSVPATVLKPGFVDEPFVAGLNQPTGTQVAPDGRIFVAQKTGEVRIIDNGNLLPAPFLTLNVNTFSERGLVGLTLDPNFASNHFVYVYYTTSGATPVNRVSRFTAGGN